MWRWRDAAQDDFAARIQWTLHSDFRLATHPPLVNVNGSVGLESLYVGIPPNESVVLDASETIDLDHSGDLSHLDFEWFFYLEPGCPHETGKQNYSGFLPIEPLAPPSGTSGSLAVNESGFSNVKLGYKVSVTNCIPQRPPDTPNWPTEYHLILQVRTQKGPYPLRRYKRVVIKSA